MEERLIMEAELRPVTLPFPDTLRVTLAMGVNQDLTKCTILSNMFCGEFSTIYQRIIVKKRKQKTKQTRKNQHNFPLFSLACKFHIMIPAPFERAQFFEVVFANLKNV
jgi:hypothetical protein